jgi:hypothetical protein
MALFEKTILPPPPLGKIKQEKLRELVGGNLIFV